MTKISTVINFSTLEKRFLSSLIEEATHFCDDIIVVAYDHFFDGTPEDVASIHNLMSTYPNITWLLHTWDTNYTSKYGHNYARWSGAEKAKHNHVLFLDGDEIPDGHLMKRWLTYEELTLPLYNFACFWYFREPQHQAKNLEACGLLADMSRMEKDMFFTNKERWFYMLYKDISIKPFCTLNRNIIFNHYSWVRTKEQLLRKVMSWAHNKDRDWVSLIEKEFSQPFSGTDFVHNYSYSSVLNIFNINCDGLC